MGSIDERQLAWLESIRVPIRKVTTLEGDVSPRKYYRIHAQDGDTLIFVAYPRSEGDAFRRFLITTRLLEAAPVRVPKVLASDESMGLMLLEDLGTLSLYDRTEEPWETLRVPVREALAQLAALARSPAERFAEVNPPLDARRLESELRDARAVFLDFDEFSGDEPTRRALRAVLDRLMSALEREPLVPTHRDFMSRNLMLPPDGSGVAVIDHQDACLAPRGYDVASLLNDSLFPSPARESECLDTLRLDPDALLSYRRCAVQRTLKATATFIKFALRGFERHLPLVGPTLARAAYQLEQLPEAGAVPSSLLERWRDRNEVATGLARLLGRSRIGAGATEC